MKPQYIIARHYTKLVISSYSEAQGDYETLVSREGLTPLQIEQIISEIVAWMVTEGLTYQIADGIIKA